MHSQSAESYRYDFPSYLLAVAKTRSINETQTTGVRGFKLSREQAIVGHVGELAFRMILFYNCPREYEATDQRDWEYDIWISGDKIDVKSSEVEDIDEPHSLYVISHETGEPYPADLYVQTLVNEEWDEVSVTGWVDKGTLFQSGQPRIIYERPALRLDSEHLRPIRDFVETE